MTHSFPTPRSSDLSGVLTTLYLTQDQFAQTNPAFQTAGNCARCRRAGALPATGGCAGLAQCWNAAVPRRRKYGSAVPDGGGSRAVVDNVDLIPSELRARLLHNGARAASDEQHDPFPVVRLHTPDANASWLLTELDPADPDLAYGLCDLGLGAPKLDYVRLATPVEIDRKIVV